jgi:hypothetical protein
LATKKAVRLCSGIPLVMLCAFSMRGQQLPASADALSGQGEAPAGVSPNQPVAIAYSAPRVSCQSNQLTIDAANSTLGSVLAAVRDCIGVEITMPDGASEQRSYVRLGPGPTRDVLDELLSSTKYSYAIQSSASAPGKIASILLIADAKDAGAVQDGRGLPPLATDGASTPARRAWIDRVRIARAAGTQPDAGESGAVAAEPGTADTSLTEQTSPNVGSAGPGDSAQPSNAADSPAAAVSPGTPNATAPSASVQAPADPTQPAQPPNELQNKIDSMQQMFEQRKKLGADPSQPPL